MRIVFMGTPRFSVPTLEKLIQSGHELVAVYTQPDRPVGRGRVLTPPPVKQIAQANGIEVLQPENLRDPVEVERLASLNPEIIVVAAFGQILPQTVLDIPKFGCLNVHPSLLPKYRGASPIASVILAGEKQTGVTIMLMDAGMDTGPILTQEQVPIEEEDTAESLEAKLAEVGAELLIRTLPEWFEHRLVPRPQREEEATYTKPISKADGEINWKLSALEIWRRVRAFYPWPGCYTRYQGKLFKILAAVPLPGEEGLPPGKVIKLSEPEVPVGVGTGEGILGLKQVQLEGKKAMPASEFLQGQRQFIGQILG